MPQNIPGPYSTFFRSYMELSSKDAYLALFAWTGIRFAKSVRHKQIQPLPSHFALMADMLLNVLHRCWDKVVEHGISTAWQLQARFLLLVA